MENKKSLSDKYYEQIEKIFCCNTSEELLGREYTVNKSIGSGSFFRIKIEEGIEITKFKVKDQLKLKFDNTQVTEDTIEIGFCYEGSVDILTKPNKIRYRIKKNDVFMYNTLNELDYFEFEYNECIMVSIIIDFNIIKNSINSIWKDKLILDLKKVIDGIFKEKVLIIERSNYELSEIAKSMYSIELNTMMDYMEFKVKVMEFLTNIIQDKHRASKNIIPIVNDCSLMCMARKIISNNLDNPPLVKDLAKKLNISEYKLQKLFKNDMDSTVYEYIRNKRIEKAKYLLRHTDLSVIEISNEIGYENPSKFSEAFKKCVNINPLKYRKSN